METLLNALWVVICAALLFAWQSQWLSQIRRRVHADAVSQSFISLVCLLALLFPAISLSDDLHPVVLALPDTKSSSVAALAHSHSAAQTHTNIPQSSAGLTVRGFAHNPLALSHVFEFGGGYIRQISVLAGPITGRAPPAVL